MSSSSNHSLISLIRSTISSSSSSPSISKEEIFLELEKMDGNSKFLYVKNLQKKIKGIIVQLLDKELSKNVVDQSLIPQLVEKVMSSNAYSLLLHAELNDVKQIVVDYIEQKQQNVLLPEQIIKKESSISGSSASGGLVFGNSSFSNTSNPNSESSYGSFSLKMSPGFEDLKALINSIVGKNVNIDVRLTAIKKYSAFGAGDLLCNELWSQTKMMLSVVLLDPDSRISLFGLRILARVFRAAPPNVFYKHDV